jgi:hypothetical protein
VNAEAAEKRCVIGTFVGEARSIRPEGYDYGYKSTGQAQSIT